MKFPNNNRVHFNVRPPENLNTGNIPELITIFKQKIKMWLKNALGREKFNLCLIINLRFSVLK